MEGLNIENMNPLLKKMEFAVTGPLVIRALEIEKVKNNYKNRNNTHSCWL